MISYRFLYPKPFSTYISLRALESSCLWPGVTREKKNNNKNTQQQHTNLKTLHAHFVRWKEAKKKNPFSLFSPYSLISLSLKFVKYIERKGMHTLYVNGIRRFDQPYALYINIFFFLISGFFFFSSSLASFHSSKRQQKKFHDLKRRRRRKKQT